jgi:hypothetical protein
MNVALVCIAKNEDNYIEEWMQYHLYLGFDHIFIYENDWRCNINSPLITKIQFDGIGNQEKAYNHFLKSYNNEYDWVAFFDVDEFLVLKKHEDIKVFLKEYNDYNGVAINWYLFGDNNLCEINGNYSMLQRFTKRRKSMDYHVKCIVKTNTNDSYSIHNFTKASVVDTNKNLVFGPFNKNTSDDIAQINHYFTKTLKEWEQKKLRGRAPYKKENEMWFRNDNDFHQHNFNEVEDLQALNFFLKKSNIF